MALITLTDEQIITAVAALNEAGADLEFFDPDFAQDQIAGGQSKLTPTDTTVEEWIAAQGEPTEIKGAVLVWDKTGVRQHPSKPGRSFRTGTYIYVLPFEGGTVARVEAA